MCARSGCVSLDGVPERQAPYFCRRSSAVLQASALPAGRGLVSLSMCLVRVTPIVRKELDGRVASAPRTRGRVHLVLALTCVLFCDRCEAASARTERGWRAYITPHHDGEPPVRVLCPACAEECVGEDETT
jgi:hypothetical protein